MQIIFKGDYDALLALDTKNKYIDTEYSPANAASFRLPVKRGG